MRSFRGLYNKKSTPLSLVMYDSSYNVQHYKQDFDFKGFIPHHLSLILQSSLFYFFQSNMRNTRLISPNSGYNKPSSVLYEIWLNKNPAEKIKKNNKDGGY